MKDWADHKGLLNDCVIYGIAHDHENTPPERCRYDVCLVVAPDFPLDEAVQQGEIPMGKYTIFTIPHTAEAVQAFWGSVIGVLQEKFDVTKPILERYKSRLIDDGTCEFSVPII